MSASLPETGSEIPHDAMNSESMQQDRAIFLRGIFGGKLTGVFRDMWRTNRTASSRKS
jgi:hypothetical protein